MRALLLAALLFAASGAFEGASAQEVKVLGTFGKWIAQTYQENGQPVCFMSVKPTTSEGNYKQRGEVLLMVTHRPSEKATNVVSVVAGYQYQRDSDAVITVTGKRFNLFTNGERAWARDAATDKTVVDLMIKGNTATVRGVSSRGTQTSDVFSLLGFTAAHKAISDNCK
jgi:invasion protein IalB